ncbi:MAG: condensation domain-containing protein, partial [Acidobacteria bacterium]|nr:condensation domain-containing protein [Acidobacteriota bacterium]
NPELTAERFRPLITLIMQMSLMKNKNNALQANLTNDQCPMTNDNSLKFPNDQCPMTNDYFYCTGDLARWLESGNIEFIGRMDEQVKLRGFRVEPGEIEKCLLNHPGIKEAVVLVREDNQKDKYLCAYLVSRTKMDLRELKEYLSRKLPAYMVPHYFVEIEKIPLTSNGKLDREALPLTVPGAAQGNETVYVGPSNIIEEKMVEIWEEVLGVVRPGVNTDFFEAGGDSIKAIQVTARLRKYGFDLKINDLYLNPSIEGAAQCVTVIKHAKAGLQDVKEGEDKPVKRVYPLSPMQSGMLLYTLKYGKSNAYFLQNVFDIEGKIDKELLEKSFHFLIEKYEILRTVFKVEVEDSGAFLQCVPEQWDFTLYFEDISHRYRDEKEAKVFLEEFAGKDREKGFNLASGEPPVRASLFKTGEKSYVLIWSFHHIVIDGWCLGILFKDLVSIYRSLEKGLPVDLGPVTPYAEYIEWLEKQDKQAGINYWQNYLEGYDCRASLSHLKREKHGADAFRGGEYNLVIEKDMISGLEKIASENRVTLSTVFQVIWGILLQEYLDCHDVVFGLVVSGRPSEIEGIEKMVGLFINTVPLRIETHQEDSFVSLLRRIHERNILSRTYEYVSLADIQAFMGLKENLVDHPVAFENFPVPSISKELAYTNADMSQDGEPGISFDMWNYEQDNRTDYDLNVIISPWEPFVITFEFNSSVYDLEFIENLGNHLKAIIKQLRKLGKLGDRQIKSNKCPAMTR